MMVAMFECRKCANRFEAMVDMDSSANLSQLRKCPVCGRAGTAGVWQAYFIGTLRVIDEVTLKSKQLFTEKAKNFCKEL